MPFVKFEPVERQPRCRSPEHDPPKMIVLPPGRHIWECPICGQQTVIVIEESEMEWRRKNS